MGRGDLTHEEAIAVAPYEKEPELRTPASELREAGYQVDERWNLRNRQRIVGNLTCHALEQV